MRARVAEVVAASALATLVTFAIAAPVIRAPSERMFGMAIVGRHYDPFTVMEQFGRPIRLGMYSQPVTDVPGALLARVAGAVAAYNWLILLSFPLAAATAYLLARYLALSRAGAVVAAMAYAFAPFHVAHAAYHPQVAQTEWLPLYLLALWWCLDEASMAAVGVLGASTVGVALSNFYGGLIAAVITPVALASYWLVVSRARTGSTRRLGVTVASLAVIASCGLIYVWYIAPVVVLNRAAFAFPRGDVFRYSAKWWSYLVPPVANPFLGAAARRLWDRAGVGVGLLEQQVSLGWGIVALGVIATFRWLVVGRAARWLPDRRKGPDGPPASLSRVPVLVLVAATALVCSLSPERTIGAFRFVRPSAVLYDVVPIFRAYARFGVAVQLMAALLAGIGVDYLLRARTRRTQIVCVALVALAAVEYAVAPSTLSRDVLPTSAHRWVMRQPGPIRVLDCTPFDRESESVEWLTGDRVRLLGGPIDDCADPNLPSKLAANGYTHLLVRRDSAAGPWFAAGARPDGLRLAADFDDGQVFAVTAPMPAIYTAAMAGFFPRERDAAWSWQWMGADAKWTVVNTGGRPVAAALALELSAFYRPRHLEMRLDGQPAGTLIVGPPRRVYEIGPLAVAPGAHELAFHAVEAPTVARDVIGNGDPRPLSFAFGASTWSARSQHP